MTSHYITLHHITSQYITLHHITSHDITLHHITSHYITQIQSAWRGYYVRTYVFDYHAQQRYMSELQKKNEAVRERLAQYQIRLELERAARKEQLMEVRTHTALWLYHSGYCSSNQHTYCITLAFLPSSCL